MFDLLKKFIGCYIQRITAIAATTLLAAGISLPSAIHAEVDPFTGFANEFSMGSEPAWWFPSDYRQMENPTLNALVPYIVSVRVTFPSWSELRPWDRHVYGNFPTYIERVHPGVLFDIQGYLMVDLQLFDGYFDNQIYSGSIEISLFDGTVYSAAIVDILPDENVMILKATTTFGGMVIYNRNFPYFDLDSSNLDLSVIQKIRLAILRHKQAPVFNPFDPMPWRPYC